MLSPAEFVESYLQIGEKKANAKTGRLFLLAILAGFAIGMGAAVTTAASGAVENPSLAKIICGTLFPLGLMIVVLTGAELFTGNCLMTIPLLGGRIGLGGIARNLTIVYFGNFAGALALAAGIAFASGPAMADWQVVKTVTTAAAKCSLPFGRALVLGILCNLLVCIAVMCALCAKDVTGRILGSFGAICMFVVCGFEHCVANMYYIPAGLFAKNLAVCSSLDLSALTWGNFLVGNLLPVTLGNLIGGCGFAALIWFGHRKAA